MQNAKKLISDYQKCRWFFTSTGKLVVGGKSASQNDELLKKLQKSHKDLIVMHTSTPGSPFSVILSDRSSLKDSDLEETAIFTGCFSREWRSRKRTANVDIFSLSQMSKSPSMPSGRWLVKGEIKSKQVPLELVLTKQENKLRAVPEKTVQQKKDILLKICPGKIDKQIMLPKFQIEIKESLSQEELLSALPAGGVTIRKK